MAKPLKLDETWIRRIVESVEGMKYGCVEIVVHDGRIVQIERTERLRFEASDSVHNQSIKEKA